MRITEKVIFDTNIIFDKIWDKPWTREHGKFFGGRDELEKFSKVVEVVFPDIVIEELENQIKRTLTEKKKTFLENPFHWIRGINLSETADFDIEKHITGLKEAEEISYTVIELTDFTVIRKMKELALKKEAPFAAEDKTDKGFKDAYVYFTILEYLQNIEDKYVFVCTKDIRLTEALEKHPNIQVIRDFEDFKKKTILSFLNPYFVEKLSAYLGFSITEGDIIDFWININDNYVLQIKGTTDIFRIEVDAGEIIGSTEIREDFDENMNMFLNAGSFQTTHGTVSFLQDYLNYFSDNEVISILKAAVENDQIRWIIGDEDVKEFIGTLFKAKGDLLDKETNETLFGLIN